jgi:hypothetical protein
MFQEKPQHLAGCIGATGIGVGPSGTTAEPSMSRSLNDPKLDQRLPVSIDMQRTLVSMTVWNMTGFDHRPDRQALQGLNRDSIAVPYIYRCILLAVKNDGR